MMDSSTLYSAIAFDGNESELLRIIVERYTPVISDYIREEMTRNFSRKFSGERREFLLEELEIFVSACEVKEKPEYLENIREARSEISDKDAPVLACGMLPDVDLLVTSDREFEQVSLETVHIVFPDEARNLLEKNL